MLQKGCWATAGGRVKGGDCAPAAPQEGLVAGHAQGCGPPLRRVVRRRRALLVGPLLREALLDCRQGLLPLRLLLRLAATVADSDITV